MSRITAAICTYGRRALLDAAITSLRAQTLPNDAYTIFVVANGPADSGLESVLERHADASNLVVITEPRVGLSHARNAALRAAPTDFIAFMDDDAAAHPGWLAALVSAFDTLGPSAGTVGGRVDLEWPVPRPAWLPDSHLGYLSAVNYGAVRRPLAEGEWLAGTNIAFRRAPLAEAGGFSTALGRHGSAAVLLSNEELEACRRLAAAGFASHYEPSAVVSHRVHPDRLTRGWFRRRIAWQAISDIIAEAVDGQSATPGDGEPVDATAPAAASADAFVEELYALRLALEALLRTGTWAPPPAKSAAQR